MRLPVNEMNEKFVGNFLMSNKINCTLESGRPTNKLKTKIINGKSYE